MHENFPEIEVIAPTETQPSLEEHLQLMKALDNWDNLVYWQEDYRIDSESQKQQEEANDNQR